MTVTIGQGTVYKPEAIKLAFGWIKHRTGTISPSCKSEYRRINKIGEIVNKNAGI